MSAPELGRAAEQADHRVLAAVLERGNHCGPTDIGPPHGKHLLPRIPRFVGHGIQRLPRAFQALDVPVVAAIVEHPDGIVLALEKPFGSDARSAAALNRLRAELDLPPSPFDALRPFVSQGTRGMLGAGLGLTPGHAEYDRFLERFLVFYGEALSVHTRLFDGIAALVDALAQG